MVNKDRILTSEAKEKEGLGGVTSPRPIHGPWPKNFIS
jgi:hypothetical protein